jgi:hypothetical protein
MTTVRVGPFEWKQWDPNQPFNGWRLVSGGPFTDAGWWATRDEAMRGVVPYLRKYFSAEINLKLKEAKKLKAQLERWLKEVAT